MNNNIICLKRMAYKEAGFGFGCVTFGVTLAHIENAATFLLS